MGALMIGALLAYRSAVFSSRSGDAAPLYSTRRHDPYGTAALYTLAIERGLETRRIEQPTLDPDDRGTLIQVPNGTRGAFGGATYHLQTRQLADWIAQGNTVVQLSRVPTELMGHFKIAVAKEVPADLLESIRGEETRGANPDEVPGTNYLARLQGEDKGLPDGRLLLREPMSFADRPNDPRWSVLARVPTYGNAIVAAELRVGRGRLILVGAPTPAINETLGQESNLDFLLSTIGDGPVLLDEWSHGIGHEATIIGFLLEAGLLPILLQVGFVAALYVWSTSQPHASDDEQMSAPEAGVGAGQVATLGFLYSRSLAPDATAERVSAEVTRRLAEALRCRPHDVCARVSSLAPDLRQRCEQLFQRLAAIQPPRDVRCPTCGYDLRGNVTGRCPECGALLSSELRHHIAQLAPSPPSTRGSMKLQTKAAFADALSLSYELSQEIRRESRVAN
jgi:predicted Zn-ribbon and HTH transcriptional regulator